MSQHNLSFQHRLRTLLVRQYRVAIAFVVLVILFSVNAYFNPRIFEPFLIQNMVNQSMTLVLAGMAQTCVVLTSGIDLSVGPIISLTNSLASTVFVDTPFGMVGTAILVLCVGALCGLINGLIVVFGRLQPIIITLATGSIYSGIALFLRPTPGGFVPRPFADLLTDRLGLLPHAAIVLLVVILFVWTPYRRSKWGLWLYAIGGNEGAAYMSGVNVRAAKLGAYIMGGLFAGMAGLFLSAQTLSGDATTGAVFTLQSIAVVVLGGTSLFGGVGGMAGTVAGAFALRIIGNILFFARINPLQQPLWEGIVILLAVSAGASQIFTVKNRLDTMR